MAQSDLPRRDLQKLALARLEESRALIRARCYSGVYYLSGYVVEFALKARIAKSFRARTVPAKKFVDAFYTHGLTQLCGLAELENERRAFEARDLGFRLNWGTVSKWTADSRYQVWNRAQARTMLSAVEDPTSGVFPWIQRFW